MSDRKANMGRNNMYKSKQPGDSDAGRNNMYKSKQPGDSDAGATEKHTRAHTHESK